MAEDVQLANPSKKRKLDAVYDSAGDSDPAAIEEATYSSLQLSDTDMDSHRNVGEGGQTDDDLLETSKSSTADSDSDSSSGCSNMSGEESWRPISGPMSWVYRHIEKGSDPRRILQQILPDDEFPKGLPPDIPEYVLWKLVISIVSEPPMRKKLTHVNTLSDVVHLMKTCSNIVVLTGAGVSVSCGIPDFRSRNGIYARLAVDFPDLPDPQAMFDINYFRNDQRPFFKFAKEIYPGQFEPSKCHKFIQLIEEHGKLLRNYTQNIDTLEQVAGIQNIIQCHGSFATAKCMLCRYKCTAEDIKEPIMQQVIPRCPKCPDDWPNAVMKPDIVFFGESLPEEFHNQMAADKDKCDLLIVIGSSLKVRPVALIPNSLPADIPQILINKELLKGQRFDVELLGDCDMIVGELCRQLGDSWDVLSGSGGGSELTEISVGMLLTPPATPADTDCEVGPTRTVDTGEFSINGQMQDDCSAKRNKFTDNKTVELPNTSEHRQLTNEVENNKLDEKAADLHLSVEDRHESHKSSIHSQQSCSDLGQVAGSEQIDSGSSTQLSNTSVPRDHVATESCSPGGGEMKDGDSSTEHTCLPEPSTDHDSEAASDKIKSGQGNCGNISDIPDQSVHPDSGENCAKTSDVEAFASKASTSRDNNNGCVTSSAVEDKTLVNDARTNLNNAATTSTANLSQGDSDTSESSRPERMMCRKTSESESGVAYGDRETCGTSSSVDELRKMWKPAVARISVSKRLGENQYCFMPPSRYVFTDAEIYTKLETDSDNDMEDDNNTSASADDHDTDTEMESGLTDANTSMNSTKNTIELAGEMDSSLPTDVSDGTDIDNVPSNDSATLEGGDNLGDLGPRL